MNSTQPLAPSKRADNLVIDAAAGLEVKTRSRFPWPRVQVSHTGRFSLEPAKVVCGDRLLIYVHGYNEDVAMARAYGNSSIAEGHAETGGECAVATFLWHSRFGAFRFGRSIEAANATAPIFAEAVGQIQVACPAMRIHVIAHSLGARVVLRAIAESGIQICDLALVAPAIDRDALEAGGEFGGVPGKAGRLLFTHNQHDKTLWWYRLRGQRALGAAGGKHPERMPANVLAVDMAKPWSTHGKDGGHGAILHPVFWGAFWKAVPGNFFQ